MRRTGLVLGLLVALVMMPTRLMAQSLDDLWKSGNAAQSLGKYEDAEKIWKQVIKIDPNNSGAYNNLGNALSDQKKLEEAITAYRKAIELDPKFAAAYYNLGVVLSDLGKKEDAIAAYRQAIKLQPDADAYNNLGNALDDLGKKEEAINAYRKAIELDPKYTKAHYNLGYVLDSLGKLEEASAAYRKAIELDPNDAHVAYNNLGIALYGQEKLEEAINAYQKAIQLDPNYAFPYRGLGDALRKQGQLEKAINAYRKAIELDPKFAQAYYGLSMALSGLGKKEEASAAYRKAAHNALGWVYEQQGELKEALAEYEAALKIDPKFEYAKNNRDAVLALLKQPQQLAYTDTRYLRSDDPLTRPKRAVVLLTPLFPQGRNQQGTGFIIKRTDNKLWILTNRHVLTDTFYSNPPRTCDSVEVQIYPGDKPRDVRITVLTSKIILIANNLDLALIELEASQLPSDIQALAISDPIENQPITTIGHPDKNPWQKDQGKVIDVDNEKLRLKISLAVGSSGSPVMTENYGVIGIIYKIDQEGTGYAIPINQIRQQLATWKVQLP